MEDLFKAKEDLDGRGSLTKDLPEAEVGVGEGMTGTTGEGKTEAGAEVEVGEEKTETTIEGGKIEAEAGVGVEEKKTPRRRMGVIIVERKDTTKTSVLKSNA